MRAALIFFLGASTAVAQDTTRPGGTREAWQITQPALFDGEQLVDLMMDHGLGVHTERVYELERIDDDYFDLSV